MKGTPLTDATYEYIVKLFAMDERALLERMQKRAADAGIPMIMVGEDQAKFIGFFVKAIGAKRVLDVGTLFGYSAAVMSRAIGPDGEVISLEFSELHAKVANENLAELGIENVTVKTGPAFEAMKALPSDSFDFILIDADKPNYVNYLNESLRLIRSGGVIAGDNAMAWGKISMPASDESANVTPGAYRPWLSPDDPDFGSVRAIQAFNTAFAEEKSLFSIIVPIGDGMAMGVVQK
jgi:predicted O-methyltransferase YrrM